MNLDLECENGQASGDQGKTCFHNNGLGFHAQATEKNCIDWKTVNHPYYRPDYYHELEQNYCRNPNGEKNAPWCFIGDDFSWKYCLSVPPCQSYGQIVGTKLWKPKKHLTCKKGCQRVYYWSKDEWSEWYRSLQSVPARCNRASFPGRMQVPLLLPRCFVQFVRRFIGRKRLMATQFCSRKTDQNLLCTRTKIGSNERYIFNLLWAWW